MPPTRHTLRGLAALCLLCVLPRLGATVLTITQTAPISYDMSPIGRDFRSGSQSVWLQPFAVPGASLVAVQYSITRSIDASMWEQNPYSDRTLTMTRAIYTDSYAIITNGVEFIQPPRPIDSASAPQIELAYLEIGRFSAQLDNSEQGRLTAPADLAVFLGPTLNIQTSTSVRAGTLFGSVGASVRGNLSLTYEYRVPDSGLPLTLWIGTLGVLIGIRGRFFRE